MHYMVSGLLLAIGLNATHSIGQDSLGLDFRTTGYFMSDGGYISETEEGAAGTKWKDEYFTSLTGGLRLLAKPSEHFRFVVNPELRSHNILPILPGNQTGEKAQKTQYEIYLEEAKGTWDLAAPGPDSRFSGKLNFGYMIHVDNPDAKVLGNYLFRSLIYPGTLFTKMDNTGAYLFGLHGSLDMLGGNFRNNFFILSEMQKYPFFDVSLAYSGSYLLGRFAEVGLGVNAKSLIPVRPSRTTPKGKEGQGLLDNTYKFVPFQTDTQVKNDSGVVIKTITVAPYATSVDSAIVTIVGAAGDTTTTIVTRDGNGIAGMNGGALANKSMTYLTPGNGSGDLYPELNGTNTHYSFAGTILSGRIALNPMGFFGDANPLGKDALKIYSEVAVLGWSNYDGFYEKRNERIPVMVGLNLPTFNQLDFLTVEVEHFGSKHLPTYDGRAQLNLPQPGAHKPGQEEKWSDARRMKDDWKWIVAAKRTFGGWGLVVQAGTDHTRLVNIEDSEFHEVLTRPSQWYTQVRFFAGIN
jgi:hypothetical protein